MGQQTADTSYWTQPSIDLCETSYDGLQTATPSPKAQSAVRPRISGYGERRQRRIDGVDARRSNTNDESLRGAGGTSTVEERQGIGNVPDPQIPTHSRTHENLYNGPQTAVPLHQAQPFPSLQIPLAEESRWR
jgi:hypothetical protein